MGLYNGFSQRALPRLSLFWLLGVSFLPLHCLMINRGIESSQTFMIAAAGGILLYIALRLLMARLQKNSASPAVRFMTAFLVSALLFLA